VVGEKCGLTVLVLVNAQSIMHIVFQLDVVLRFDSTVVIKCTYPYIVPKVSNQIFKNF